MEQQPSRSTLFREEQESINEEGGEEGKKRGGEKIKPNTWAGHNACHANVHHRKRGPHMLGPVGIWALASDVALYGESLSNIPQPVKTATGKRQSQGTNLAWKSF